MSKKELYLSDVILGELSVKRLSDEDSDKRKNTRINVSYAKVNNKDKLNLWLPVEIDSETHKFHVKLEVVGIFNNAEEVSKDYDAHDSILIAQVWPTVVDILTSLFGRMGILNFKVPSFAQLNKKDEMDD